MEEKIVENAVEQQASGDVKQKSKDDESAERDKGRDLATCERLMTQGIMRSADLAKHMGLSVQTAAALKRKIMRDWEELADSAGAAHSVGRFVRKAELVERTAWTLLSDEEEDRQEKTNVLKVILSAIEQESELLGPGNGKVKNEGEEDSGKEFADYKRRVESIVETFEKRGDASRSQ